MMVLLVNMMVIILMASLMLQLLTVLVKALIFSLPLPCSSTPEPDSLGQ